MNFCQYDSTIWSSLTFLRNYLTFVGKVAFSIGWENVHLVCVLLCQNKMNMDWSTQQMWVIQRSRKSQKNATVLQDACISSLWVSNHYSFLYGPLTCNYGLFRMSIKALVCNLTLCHTGCLPLLASLQFYFNSVFYFTTEISQVFASDDKSSKFEKLVSFTGKFMVIRKFPRYLIYILYSW